MTALSPLHDQNKVARRALRKRRGRRFVIGVNVAFSFVLMLVFVVLLNVLTSAFPLRANVSVHNVFRLSDKTLAVLKQIPGPVDIKVFYQRSQAELRDIINLLNEYEYHAPMVSFEVIDPDRNLAGTEALVAQYGLTEPNVVLFHYDGRTHQVKAEDIMEYDFSPVRQGLAPARSSFLGERAFTSALRRVTETSRPVVYFLTGHGERRMDNFDPFAGYSSIAKRMTRDHMDVRMLALGEAQSIPEDCAALIVAGPTRRIAQPELDIMVDYLEESGRALILVDALHQTGLDSLLLRWGVQLGDDIVVDPRRSITGRELFVTQYGFHPITDRLQGITTIFHMPRSVIPVAPPQTLAANQADKPHATVLAASSDRGWAERSPDRAPMRFDEGQDVPGPVPVALAVERGPVAGIDVQIQSSRLVVIGDAGFVANGALTGGDEDFFMSALNWLLDREWLMAIGPKPVVEEKLMLDRDQLKRLFKIFVIACPGVAVFMGLLVHMRRRL